MLDLLRADEMDVTVEPAGGEDFALARDHLAAAEFHLLAIGGKILLHLDDEIGVGQPHPIASGGAEHVGIEGAGDFNGHCACSNASCACRTDFCKKLEIWPRHQGRP